MSQAAYVGLEALINKFSEFIEWILEQRKKSETDKLIALNSNLINQFGFSIFDVAENAFDIVKIKLEKTNSRILDDIISSLFNISISTNKNQTCQRLKSNTNLKERIMEIILFTEKRYNKISLESSTIKNSLQQHLRLNIRAPGL